MPTPRLSAIQQASPVSPLPFTSMLDVPYYDPSVSCFSRQIIMSPTPCSRRFDEVGFLCGAGFQPAAPLTPPASTGQPTGTKDGMITMEKAVTELYTHNLTSREEALKFIKSPQQRQAMRTF